MQRKPFVWYLRLGNVPSEVGRLQRKSTRTTSPSPISGGKRAPKCSTKQSAQTEFSMPVPNLTPPADPRAQTLRTAWIAPSSGGPCGRGLESSRRFLQGDRVERWTPLKFPSPQSWERYGESDWCGDQVVGLPPTQRKGSFGQVTRVPPGSRYYPVRLPPRWGFRVSPPGLASPSRRNLELLICSLLLPFHQGSELGQ